MNGSNNNFDAILKTAADDLVRRDLKTAQSIDTSHTVISEKRLKQSRRKIRTFDRQSMWLKIPVTYRRIVAAVLVVCTMSFTLCLSVEAIRVEIANTVLEWYEKFVSVFYVTEIEVPETIKEYREPALQIVGTERQVVLQGELTYQIYYIFEEDIVLTYHQNILNKQSNDLDREHNCIQKEIKIHDYEAHLFIYEDGTQSVTWHDGQYSYVIYAFTTQTDTDMLVHVAESVK